MEREVSAGSATGPSARLVGSGRIGSGLSNPWDCNIFLVGDEADTVLIDAGCGLEPGPILERIEAALGGRRLHGILLTHAHADHAGGAAALSSALGIPVYAHELALQRLQESDEVTTGLAEARDRGDYPSAVRLLPPADMRAMPSAGMRLGRLTVRPVAVGGHSADHLAYLFPHPDAPLVFSGDLVFTDGEIAPQTTPDYDQSALLTTIRTMADAAGSEGRFTLYPGHGDPVTDAAGMLEATVERAAHGEIRRLVY
jgi:glyoxylase-like metal-dependent hydrolase (beta-lactamase superfamily II)